MNDDSLDDRGKSEISNLKSQIPDSQPRNNSAAFPLQACRRAALLYPTRIHTAFKYSVSGTVADTG